MNEESAMYSVPVTVVPLAPLGVNVTGMETLWPGLTTYGVNVAAALVLPSHRSPVGELTAGSKPAVVAVIDTLAFTFLAGFLPVGPTRNGVTVQSPAPTSDAE